MTAQQGHGLGTRSRPWYWKLLMPPGLSGSRHRRRGRSRQRNDSRTLREHPPSARKRKPGRCRDGNRQSLQWHAPAAWIPIHERQCAYEHLLETFRGGIRNNAVLIQVKIRFLSLPNPRQTDQSISARRHSHGAKPKRSTPHCRRMHCPTPTDLVNPHRA